MIPVYARIKPGGGSGGGDGGGGAVLLVDGRTVRAATGGSYRFHQVFDGLASQHDVYASVVAPAVDDLLQRHQDSTILSFGPSNSGKSHTMVGDDERPGMIPLALAAIMAHRPRPAVTLSVYELHNDTAVDMVAGLPVKRSALEIYTHASGRTECNVEKRSVESVEEAQTLLRESLGRRSTSSTATNHSSSRLHCFVVVDTVAASSTARLQFVDLAGSERVDQAHTQGQQLREGAYTNRTLSELGRVLGLMNQRNILVTAGTFRHSKLTRLVFSDLVSPAVELSLRMVVCLDPQGDSGTVAQTLRYLDPVGGIRVAKTPQRRSVFWSPRSARSPVGVVLHSPIRAASRLMTSTPCLLPRGLPPVSRIRRSMASVQRRLGEVGKVVRENGELREAVKVLQRETEAQERRLRQLEQELEHVRGLVYRGIGDAVDAERVAGRKVLEHTARQHTTLVLEYAAKEDRWRKERRELRARIRDKENGAPVL